MYVPDLRSERDLAEIDEGIASLRARGLETEDDIKAVSLGQQPEEQWARPRGSEVALG